MKNRHVLLGSGIALFASLCFADVAIQDWQFDDENGTALNAVANSGTLGSSWNYGGPRVFNGNLIIGDFIYYKWNPPAGKSNFRMAEFPEITSGKYIFQFVVSDWNLAGSDGVGALNNGIRFFVGDSENGMAQMFFGVQKGNDIVVRTQGCSHKNLTGTNKQQGLWNLDLTNSAPVAVQLLVDLDTGEWSTRLDIRKNGKFVDLVTDGGGMTSLNRIQLVVDAKEPWEFAGEQKESTEFIRIDSVTLTRVEPQP